MFFFTRVFFGRRWRQDPLKPGGNFVGKIVNVSADESVMTNGKVDYKKLHIITFDPITMKYVALGEEVASAFKEGLKLR